jgi:hypothetical protein
VKRHANSTTNLSLRERSGGSARVRVIAFCVCALTEPLPRAPAESNTPKARHTTPKARHTIFSGILGLVAIFLMGRGLK